MKNRILALVLLVLAGALFALAYDEKEYTPGPVPNSMYFIRNFTATNGQWTLTNAETYAWYIQDFRYVLPPRVTNTIGVRLVQVVRVDQVTGNVVETNDIGIVETNYHSDVTTSYAYVTNDLYRVNVSNATDTDLMQSFQLPYDYIQRDDVLAITNATATNIPITIIGWR
jgi:hypothetical protein